MIAEQRDREHRHVGDRVLEAGGDEGEQAPPDQDAFRRVAGRPLARPQRETDEPVAQRAARDERGRRRAHLGGRGGEDEIGAVLEDLPAAAEPEDERQQNGAGEVADPGEDPGRGPRAAPSTVPRARPMVMNIVWPVKRSEPAKTTSVSAMPKQAPMTRLRKAGSICWPRVKMRMMPMPT